LHNLKFRKNNGTSTTKKRGFHFNRSLPTPIEGCLGVCLKRQKPKIGVGDWLVFKNDSSKLMVYASEVSNHNPRLKSVKTAAEKTAKQLNMNFEVVKKTKSSSQIYVYYENGADDPIPIYCDEGKNGDLQEIRTKIKSMMFVLSFHPKHSELKQVRSNIIAL
jgi:hypothetical protein